MRRHRSKGQALIMVTLGLIAMVGMMGLAVDLGWSFFVEKQAQAAADAGALAAAEQAMRNLGGVTTGIACDVVAYCAATPVNCSTVSGTPTSNLWNGCLYAQRNGFEDGGLSGRQTVTIQANVTPPVPPTAPGINDIRYWVTVRTTQTVPQLFSAVLGNPEGRVSAAATAGIVASVVPGSFFGLNREGDCIATGNSRVGFDELCGVDVKLQGSGGNSAPPCPDSGGANGTLCAGDGIALNSTCHGDGTQTGCSDPGGSGGGKGGGGAGNYTGITGGSASVWSGGAQIRDDPATGNTGAVNNPNAWIPQPVPTDDENVFRDPFEGKYQPPLISSNVGLCGVLDGQITGSADPAAPQSIGPYMYYAIDNTGKATGNRMRIVGNVTFDGNAPCGNAHPFNTQYSAGSSQDANFPMYMFYGGLELSGQTMHFGPGEYVMVGTRTGTGGSSPGTGASLYLPNGNETVTGDTNAGTLFVTTAPHMPTATGGTSYPGLDAQVQSLWNAHPELTNIAMFQGHVEMKAGQSTSLQLNGLDTSMISNSNTQAALGDQENVLLWQDRRNSTILFNPDGTINTSGANGGFPCKNGCGTVPQALANNGVNEYSPEFIFNAALQMQMNGVIYQPRGAWFSYQGNADISSSLRVVTGMINMTGGGQLSLLPTAAPIIRYIVALIY